MKKLERRNPEMNRAMTAPVLEPVWEGRADNDEQTGIGSSQIKYELASLLPPLT